MFEAATSSLVGDGASTLFWIDRWLPGGRIKDFAPNLFTVVPTRSIRSRMVREGLTGGWLDDITPDLSAQAIAELLDIADRLEGFTLVEGTADKFVWNWETGGVYSSRSCYRSFFGGRVGMAGALQIWRSRAPPKCRFFLWLAARNRQLTGSVGAGCPIMRHALSVTSTTSPSITFC